ncbi:bifunctional Mediator complex [Babesia duncani]|uniref:Mediator of RNA polymerase II transcription subunit 6 n=1 Tax=Babesia duncani TaxID=323732 RepID=A0AAD9PKD1_9APIC|nr:bifunctional Mediator complex [Babesia duncani]
MDAQQAMDDSEFTREYEADCAIEFIDPKYLSTNVLDSEYAALDCLLISYTFNGTIDFFQSPFYLKYRESCLNEKIRAGKSVDSNEAGLIFEVTYSNIETINSTFENAESRTPNLYVSLAVFHITLFSRDLSQSGISNTPIKVYYLVQGSIFCCPPFGSLVRQRLHKGICDFEKFYDSINNISRWSITNGYTWCPNPPKTDPTVERLCMRYNFTREQVEEFVKKGSMHIFYLLPLDNVAVKVARDLIRQLQP